MLGFIFLKYTSDSFEVKHAQLLQGSAASSPAGIGAPADPALSQYAGADPEDADEYKAENVFWVLPAARWTCLQNSAKQPAIKASLEGREYGG